MYLIITIDNGINAQTQVRLAQRLGIDVLVIDHHQIETRADAPAVWSEEYSAAGLAFMLSWALLQDFGMSRENTEAFLHSLSRLAAIAAIADCVPLRGPTRVLTQLGLDALQRTRHPGLLKLMELAGFYANLTPSSEQIAFRLAPRINAAGRVGHPAQVLEMLYAPTAELAISKAIVLDQLNQQRRRLEKVALKELFVLAGKGPREVMVIYGPNWKKGIAGILASRARERYDVPAFVLVKDERTGMAVGSGRSVEGADLVDALRACAPVLHRYGGHSQAAGVTLLIENIPLFRKCLEDFVERSPPRRPDRTKAEATLNLMDLSRAFHDQLRCWEPFGIGNPAPVFAIPAATLEQASGEKVLIRQGPRSLKARGQKLPDQEGAGEALVAMTATSATLLRFTPA